jgi:predicted nucleic acid-binding protein
VSRFVVDASVVLAWAFPDENSDVAVRVTRRFQQGDVALVPAFWPHEVLNALLVGEKRKRISAELVQTFLTDLEALRIVPELVPAREVFVRIRSISHEHGLTAYDAAYLDLAKMRSLPIATLDHDLMRACGKAGVDLL